MIASVSMRAQLQRRPARPLLVVAVTGGLAAACGGPGLSARTAVPEDPTPLTKCQVAAGQSSPLVTEWPAAEKARLEGLIAQGGVAVRYSGCEMTLLDGCKLEGSYAFQRTTLSTDMLEIRNADELYARLPLGAASLEGELDRTGRLAIRTTISGQLLFRGDPSRLPAGGVCAGATHVITAISIGAFKMLSGGAVGGGGGVRVAGAGAGGRVSRAEEMLKQAGAPERCAEAADGAASADCSSPIQVFLTPLPEQPAAVSAPPEPAPPPVPAPPSPWQGAPPMSPLQGASPPAQQQNAVYVRIPAVPDGAWTLHAKFGGAVCQLPCSVWLAREKGYFLQRDGEGARVDLPSLERVPGVETDVALLPPRGSKALGIIGISAGGVAVIAGLVVFLDGALDEQGPAPGLLLSTAGLALTTGGIIYTVYSRSNYKPVYRAGAWEPGAPGSQVRIGVGLGKIIGAF